MKKTCLCGLDHSDKTFIESYTAPPIVRMYSSETPEIKCICHVCWSVWNEGDKITHKNDCLYLFTLFSKWMYNDNGHKSGTSLQDFLNNEGACMVMPTSDEINLEKIKICPECNGLKLGFSKGDEPDFRICPECFGKGFLELDEEALKNTVS